MKNNIILSILLIIPYQINAQTIITIDGSQMVQSGGVVVLNNTKLVNNSTFDAGTGEVKIEGDGTTAQTAIGGTANTAFYTLQINKSDNNVQLDNAISVSNQLILTNGHLDLQTYDLTILSGGAISGGSSSSFIRTSSSGQLIQEVGATNVVFPIGYANYVPLTINNSGTTDNFQVRVEDAVYQNGTSGTELTTDVLDCTWYIDEGTTLGSDVTLTFQWNTDDELTDFDRSNAFVSHYTNNAWVNHSTQSATGSNPYTITQSGITEFSAFTIASDVSALPVELLYFYAEKEGENVRLDWQTATEINNSHFDVEWSRDGISFEKIGEVQGAGTTDEIQFYEFLDNPNLRGLDPDSYRDLGFNYYRLRQVDFDGKFEYSKILHVNFEQSNFRTINIYPNPATDYVIIENTQENEVAKIFSVNGQLVKTIQILNNQQEIPIGHLAKGTYFFKIGNTVKRVLIQ